MPDPTRRHLLLAGLAGLVTQAGCGRGATRGPEARTPAEDPAMSPTAPTPRRQPATFVSHGAPTLALDAERGADLARWGRGLGTPSAYLVVSAHWERTPLSVGTGSRRELMYDFGGFPDELYRVRYDAPAAPDLARRLALETGAEVRDERPWDHGVWVPLMHLQPDAGVPVVQLSLPSRLSGADLLDLGRRLAPLRDEGVRVLGSGGMVHNLRAVDFSEREASPAWATEFEAWAREALAAGDLDALADVRGRAPGSNLAHPTLEHYLPLLVAAGAGEGEPVAFPVEGFEYGSLSRTAVQFGTA